MTEHQELSGDEEELVRKIVADAKKIDLGSAKESREFLEPPPRDRVELWKNLTKNDIHLLLQRHMGPAFTIESMVQANKGRLNISRIPGVQAELNALESEVVDASVETFDEVQSDLFYHAAAEATKLHNVPDAHFPYYKKILKAAVAKLREECERN